MRISRSFFSWLRMALVVALLLVSAPPAFSDDEDNVKQQPAGASQDQPEQSAQERQEEQERRDAQEQERMARELAERQAEAEAARKAQEEEEVAAAAAAKKNSDDLFDIDIYECIPPKGDRAPARKAPLEAGVVLTLCVKPKHDNNIQIRLQSFGTIQTSVQGGFAQTIIRDNKAADPMSRVMCPFHENLNLCIFATRLDEKFFEKAAKATTTGDITVINRDTDEERVVNFSYNFKVAKSKPPPPVEHDYLDMTNVQDTFPMANEIQMWLLAAILLILLEFAFSPSDSDDDGKKKTKDSSSNKKAADKKKKPKKE